MTLVNNLFTAILKAICAPANNGGLFKKVKKAPFNPKIALGFNF
jgi:hypothetical protein